MNMELEIISLLKKYNIEYALTLPCAKINNLLKLSAKHFYHIPLSREEEGIGISTGIYLAGKRSILMFQSGGIGNSINALLSLAKSYSIPMPMIISWRGIYKEKIAAQKPMGEFLPDIFKSMRIPFFEIHNKDDFKKINEALSLAYSDSTPVGILVSPVFWMKKQRSEVETEIKNSQSRKVIKFSITKSKIKRKEPCITRYEAISAISEHLKNKIVICNIGIPSKELYAIRDQESNFYMLGSFGMTSAIGLGIALVKNSDVFILDGDASILTNPNILGTIIQEKKYSKNLTIILLDNGVCGSTGNQLTIAYNNLDLELLAQAYGFTNTMKAYNKQEMLELLNIKKQGPTFFHFVLKPGNAQVKNIPIKMNDIKNRFMEKISNYD